MSRPPLIHSENAFANTQIGPISPKAQPLLELVPERLSGQHSSLGLPGEALEPAKILHSANGCFANKARRQGM